MNKREAWINFLLIASVWGIDALTKAIALAKINSITFWGPFGLVLHQNPGAMLGAFSDLPPILRIVSLSTGGAFLVVIYLTLQYLIPTPAPTLRRGMSILLGGILGNVCDRVLHGAIVDFLIIGRPGFSTPAFNLADALQWVGYAMVMFFLFRHGNELWPEQNVRRRVWINPQFQKKYVGILLTIGLSFSLICGVFFYTYLKIVIDDLVIGHAPAFERRFLVPFLITFSVIAASFILLLFILGRRLSHRVAGPVYAFEKYLEDLLKGNFREFRIRSGDEFPHLEDLGRDLRIELKARHDERNGIARQQLIVDEDDLDPDSNS